MKDEELKAALAMHLCPVGLLNICEAHQTRVTDFYIYQEDMIPALRDIRIKMFADMELSPSDLVVLKYIVPNLMKD